MHEQLKEFWNETDGDFLVQPMTLFFTPWTKFRQKYLNKGEKFDYHTFWEKYDSEQFWKEFDATGVKGFIFENHIGLENVKDLAGDGLYVYAMRHGDDWCKPCDIESGEVVVNFYAYFVTDQNLDHYFTPKKDWKKIYTWSMDWCDEHYWE